MEFMISIINTKCVKYFQWLNKMDKVLMLCHRTPPIHGASIIGDTIHNILKKEGFNIAYIPLSSSTNIKNIGAINFSKISFILGL